MREAVGLFESSCYAKFDVTGPGATAFLDRLSSNKLPQADGKTALAPLLTPKGQVFGDLTVTRLAADHYLMIGSPTAIVYYQRWFDRHRGADDVTIRDVTADWTGFSLTGPKARDVLAELVSEDISHKAFPFLSARRMTVGLADAIVIRVSFTGELGYEIYTAPEHQLHVLERLRAAGKAHGLKLCGMRALNALRLEKGYGSWGREFSVDYTPAEAGLGRFVRLDKGNFIGRDAGATHSGRATEAPARDLCGRRRRRRSDGQRADPRRRRSGRAIDLGRLHVSRETFRWFGLHPQRLSRRGEQAGDRDPRRAPPRAHPQGRAV